LGDFVMVRDRFSDEPLGAVVENEEGFFCFHPNGTPLTVRQLLELAEQISAMNEGEANGLI
jgi:hypothetical protein